MYAIVDIETTGGYANNHRITEIGIVLHNGEKVEQTYSSLINPERDIPAHITHLTGITEEMVERAPTFTEIKEEVKALLANRIFIAHNVNFDYGFLKHEFHRIGEEFAYKRMCSIRYFRKVFPGLPSYSLGKIARHYGIENPARHRALGDAITTTRLLELAFQKDKGEILNQLVKQNNGEITLPYQLDKKLIDKIPEASGIYLFKNNENKIIYVGKAKKLKKRITSHFTGAASSKRKQAFYREISNIEYILTGNESCAAIFEDHYIRKNWPRYNRAQKQKNNLIGVFVYEDRVGAQRIGIVQKSRHQQPLKVFFSNYQARNWVFEQAEKYALNKQLCGLPFESDELIEVKEHNKRIKTWLNDLKSDKSEEYFVFEKGRYPNEIGLLHQENDQSISIAFVNQKVFEKEGITSSRLQFEQLSLSGATIRFVEELKSKSTVIHL